MDTKHFNILAAATFISLALAGIVHGAYNTWTSEKVEGEKLMPGFGGYADRIAQVTVQQGETTLTFKKGDNNNWKLTERDAYPVKSVKVRELLRSIAMAELVETKTRAPKRYALLELEDPAGKNAQSKLIKMGTASGQYLADLVVGKQRAGAFGSGKPGSYVRRPGNDQTWLSNTVIEVPMEVTDWVDPAFLKLPADQIRSVKLTPPDGEAINLVLDELAGTDAKADGAKAGQGDVKAATQKGEPKFKFATVPEGKKLKSSINATSMVKRLETFELADVRKAGSVKAPKDVKTFKALIETKKGIQLDTSALAIGEDERWVSIKVVADGTDAEAAKQLKASVEGWEFKVPEWRFKQFFKTAADMFEENKEEKAESNPEEEAGNTPTSPPPLLLRKPE